MKKGITKPVQKKKAAKHVSVLLIFFMALTLFFVLLLPGCTGPEQENKLIEEEKIPIRMAYLYNDLHQLAYYVAQQKGFYEDAGLQVKEAGVYGSGVELMAAFQAGSLDAGYVGLAPATVAVANGKAEVSVVALANQVGSALVVRDGLEVEAIADLEGQRVAVPNLGTVQDFLLNRALEEAGLKTTAVEKTFISPSEMISGMASEGIEACIAWEPYVSKLVNRGYGQVLLWSHEIWENHPCCVLAVDEEFLKNNREAAASLVEAHNRATDFILQNKEEAKEMAKDFTGLSEDVVKEAMENIEFTSELDAEEAETYARYLVNQGLVELEDTAAFMSEFIHESLLEEGIN